jgi:hypothetical protein
MKAMFKQPKIKAILLFLALLTSPQIATIISAHATQDREWTFMVYLDADNNLESAGIKDINEMETVGSSNALAITVQIDRISGYDSSNQNWTETRRYYITKDNNMETINSNLLENLGEQNMGDKNTLTSFVTWAIQTYPANHYALILWDHGGGYPGVCWDDTNNEDYLTMLELKEALANIYNGASRKIDVLAFDACLMGMIEVVYQIRNYVSYMVASEETEPGDGYPYNLILAELAASPSMTPERLATTIVTKYVNSYTDGLADPEDDPKITSSAFNLTAISETTSAVSRLAQAIVGDFGNCKTALREAWAQAETFQGDFVDLYHFTTLLKGKVSNNTVKAEAQTILETATALILCEAHGQVHSNASGVSIYYPKKYAKTFYIDLDFCNDTFWDEFLSFATNVDAEVSPVCPPYTSAENIIFIDVAIGDVDGDHEAEIIAVGNYSDFGETYFVIAVFEMTESGLVHFCNLTINLGAYEALLSVDCADVDNDSVEEIVACGGYYYEAEDVWYSYIGIFTVEGNKLVVQAYDEGANISVESLDIADVDGDDFPEIVISGYFWDEYSIYAYVAVGNNSAVNSLDLECSYSWYIGYDADLKSVRVGDTDADGIAEIVVGGVYYDYYMFTWVSYLAVLNCSQNRLQLQAYDSGANYWINSLDIADLDGDGFFEIVISGYCWDFYGNIYMFISIGNNLNPNEITGLGTYYWIVSGNSFIYSVDVADVDGDGMAEILAVGFYYDISSGNWASYSAILCWSQVTGLMVENIHLGESQTYGYSVTTGNIDHDAQTEFVTCEEEKGSSSRAKITVVEATNHIVTNGTISGRVTDGENPLYNATVEVSIPRMSIVASTKTLSDGYYTLSNIPEGCYTITVSAEGKLDSTRNGIIVKAGQTTKQDFALTRNAITTANHLINVYGQNFYIVTVSNSTISNFLFSLASKCITFSVVATTDTVGFCDITIPQNLLVPPYTVEIDGNMVEPPMYSNGTHTFIHLVYTHSAHTIKITGAAAIPEFSFSPILLVFACLPFILFLVKKFAFLKVKFNGQQQTY